MKKDIAPPPMFTKHEIDAHCKYGGYYPETKTFKPFEDYEYVSDVLDAIAAAVEAGVVDRNAWVSQFFANKEVFERWMEELSGFSDTDHMRDRWYYALFSMVNAVNEEGFVTSYEIAERMLAQAEETNQL